MGKKNYRGVIEFGDGSKLKLPLQRNKASAKKYLLLQAQYSKVCGNEYYNFRKGVAGHRNTPGDSGGVTGLYLEVWERIAKHEVYIEDGLVKLSDALGVE